jgi:hypothetical protein
VEPRISDSRIDSPAGNSLPTAAARRHRARIIALPNVAATGNKDFITSLLSDGGIDVRIDWDGDPDNRGHFEARVDSDSWARCPNIEAGPVNDVVSPNASPTGEVTAVRICRGPGYPTVPFRVKVMPITWLEHREPDREMAPDYTAERDVDYVYRDGQGPEEYEWQDSQSIGSEGAQRVDASLEPGVAYEMHVRLQHPSDPEVWQLQDPIVRNDHGGSN